VTLSALSDSTGLKAEGLMGCPAFAGASAVAQAMAGPNGKAKEVTYTSAKVLNILTKVLDKKQVLRSSLMAEGGPARTHF
jgi:hypothetical protein